MGRTPQVKGGRRRDLAERSPATMTEACPPFEYGVLLPHFGAAATRERLVGGAQRIEQLGFDSIWVRDHIVFRPHGFESLDNTHVEPFTVLSAAAAVTGRIKLGTAALIPHRHPIYAALLAASVDFLAGPGRLILGWGLGWSEHEFKSVGMADVDRRPLLGEQVDIFRKLWSGQRVAHAGARYSFDDVDIRPVPELPIPIWYCGTTMASVRRAVEYCDGWIPGRLPMPDLKRCVRRLETLASEAGKPRPMVGSIPYVVPARTREEALRYLNLDALLAETNARYTPPPSGAFQNADDLDGALFYGPAENIVEGVRRSQEAGVHHFVFDLRARFADFETCLQMLAEDVLPQLRRSSSPKQVPAQEGWGR
jgi:probable F420-dependent oxidoreductase